MSLRIRRGTDAQRATTPLDLGELVFTTDTKQLYVGNGIDNGGDPIIRLGTGLAWADAECTTIIATGAALQVSADADPSLGGNLDLNSYTINGTGGISITGNIQTFRFLNDALISSPIALFRARGTSVTPLTVLAGDQLNKISSQGYSSGSYKVSSLIINSVSSKFPVTSTAVPGRIDFNVADGSGNLNLALSIDADMGTRLQTFSPNVTQLGVYSYLATPGGTGTYTNFGRYGGTTAASVSLTTGDRIHSLRFMGYDGANLLIGSQITSNVYGTVSTGQLQSDIRLTCKNSAGTLITTQTNRATQIQFAVMPILPTFAGTAAATTAVSNAVTLSGIVTVDTSGGFTLGTSFAGNLVVGRQITISGTLSGATITGYTDPTTYFITATNGSTTFTLSTTSGGPAITTTAGTLTGATFVLTTLPVDGMMFYDSVTLKITSYANGAWEVLH